jgi:hypothetical protein
MDTAAGLPLSVWVTAKLTTASAPTKLSIHPEEPVAKERQFSFTGSAAWYTKSRFPS